MTAGTDNRNDNIVPIFLACDCDMDWWSQGLDRIEKLQWIEKNCRGQDNLERLGSSTFYLRRRHKKKKTVTCLTEGRYSHWLQSKQRRQAEVQRVCPINSINLPLWHYCHKSDWSITNEDVAQLRYNLFFPAFLSVLTTVHWETTTFASTFRFRLIE